MKIDLTKDELDRIILNMDQIAVEYGDIDDIYLLNKLIKFRNTTPTDGSDENKPD